MIIDYIFWGVTGFFYVSFVGIMIRDAYRNRKEEEKR